MKYTKEERLAIGQEIYTQALSIAEAKEKYEIGQSTAEKYLTDYKRENGIPLHNQSPSQQNAKKTAASIPTLDMDAYMTMSKEELIDELIRAKVNEARAKKGYEVKGVGVNKEYSSINNKNSKS